MLGGVLRRRGLIAHVALVIGLMSGCGRISFDKVGDGAEGDGALSDGSALRDTWTAIPTDPTGRSDHTAVWTGTEMIIWGGGNPAAMNTGSRFNPATNAWTPVTTTGAPSARLGHRAVWTGSRMVVWGGATGFSGTDTYFGDGGIYDPVSDSWQSLPAGASGEPSGRKEFAMIWSGTRVIVWGGNYFQNPSFVYPADGGVLDPGTGTWTSIVAGMPNEPSGRRSSCGLAISGGRLMVWGGWDGSSNLQNGGIYDLGGNSWTSLLAGQPNEPAGRYVHACAWASSLAMVWGGWITNGPAFGDGGLLDPSTGTWTNVSAGATNEPGATMMPTAIWTGARVLVFGTGGAAAFDPATSSWSLLSMIGAPSTDRNAFTAVWTGTEMIVWGGNAGTIYRNDGGRYVP